MKYLVLATLTLTLLPHGAWAQKTTFDFDKTANFAPYRTYELRDGTKVGDSVYDIQIAAAIEEELAAKGLTTSGMPDIAVVYHFSIDRMKDITSWSQGGGPYHWTWGSGWDNTDVRVNHLYVGTLIIDVADLKTNGMVWRGIEKGELNPRARPEHRDRNLRRAIDRILKNYPPKKKK